MFLQEGDRILISHRRQFDNEQPRYFIGTVCAYDDGLAKVTGYTFVRDMASGRVLKKEDKRTKIIPLTSSSMIVYELPRDTDIEAATFDLHEGDLNLTDGGSLHMNMAEYAHAGHI